MSQVEFWFEFASTYSYPAAERVARLVECKAANVAYRPLLLGPIFAAQGWNTSPFNIYEAKGRNMWRDVERRCEVLGLPFVRPDIFPQNGLIAARVVTALGQHEAVPALVCRLYRMNFVDNRDLSQPDTVAEALTDVGLEAAHWFAEAKSDATKQALRQSGERAAALGIFGAPSFTVNNDLFWGEDRLDQALAHADVPTAMPNLRVRPFTSQDTHDVIALWRASNLTTPSNDPAADIALKRTTQPALFLVALDSTGIVGSCMAGFDGHRGWLNYLAVDPHARRKGIGTALVHAAEARLRALGCPKVNLQVRGENAAVAAFYTALGYVVEDRLSLGKRFP